MAVMVSQCDGVTPPPSPPAEDEPAKMMRPPPGGGLRRQKTSTGLPRSFSYESLDEGMLKASLSQSIKREDWPTVRKIILGWSLSLGCFLVMLFTFACYGCLLFEDRRERMDTNVPPGNTDELLIGWGFSAGQRFILHEPTLILAAKGLPILFASEFCANCEWLIIEPPRNAGVESVPLPCCCRSTSNFAATYSRRAGCGETIVNLLSMVFTCLVEAIKSIKA